ncbi:hypothetical protein YC2023_070570 [Brassica napus]
MSDDWWNELPSRKLKDRPIAHLDLMEKVFGMVPISGGERWTDQQGKEHLDQQGEDHMDQFHDVVMLKTHMLQIGEFLLLRKPVLQLNQQLLAP